MSLDAAPALAERAAFPRAAGGLSGAALPVALGALLSVGLAALVAGKPAAGGWKAASEGTLALLAAIGVAGVGASLWLSTRPYWIVAGLLVPSALAMEFFVFANVDIGPANLYLQDCFFALFMLSLAWRWLAAPVGTNPFAENALGRLTVPLFATVALGAAQTARALAMGIDFNDALGDFRRGYFYILAYLAPFLLPDRAKARRFLEAVFVAASALLVAKGLGQGALGKLDRRMQIDAAHILAHFELVLVGFLAYYCLARLLAGGSRRKGLLLAGLVLATLVVMLGNFRAAWLGFAAGGFAIFLLAPGRWKAGMAALGAAGAVAVACLIALAWNVETAPGRTVGDELTLKVAKLGDSSRDHNVIWRYQSYAAALEAWREKPILGAGLGYKTSFFYVRSDGSPAVASRHRTHNSYLWVLSTVGVAGFAVFAWLHLSFAVGSFVRMRRIARAGGAIPPFALAAFGFYAAFMATTAFDVLLEDALRVIWLTVAMASVELSLDEPARQR